MPVVPRDDAALDAAIADLAGQFRAEWRTATSNELERALAAPVAMRLPAASAARAALADHPNPLVRADALWPRRLASTFQ